MSLDRVFSSSSVRILSSKLYRILKSSVDSQCEIICRVSFLLLVLLYGFYMKCRILLENVYWAAQDLFVVPKFRDSRELRSYLVDRRRTFRKTPDHIVLILGPEKPSHEDLAKLISWCEPVGVRHISFYHHDDGIDPLLIFEAVKRSARHIIHKIKWGGSFSDDVKRASVKQINGFRWEGVVRVDVLCRRAGNEELVQVARELSGRGAAGGALDQGSLCRALEQKLRAPPPDLAIVCGPAMSYYACTPWHLRLTQFVHIQSHHCLQVSKFLNCLHQYSDCEQRCGK